MSPKLLSYIIFEHVKENPIDLDLLQYYFRAAIYEKFGHGGNLLGYLKAMIKLLVF